MAEITKVTTPMIPRENVGNKFKPVSDQALDLHDASKVQKKADDKKTGDREGGGQALRENLGKAIVQPLLRDSNEVSFALRKIVSLLQYGISTAEVLAADPIRQLLGKLFVAPGELLGQLQQQEESAVLFKGEVFDALRLIAGKFPDNPRVMNAAANLLKVFEQHVNAQNSLKTILYSCRNILEYLFSQDRAQFASYLDGLESILLPDIRLQQGHAQQAAVPDEADDLQKPTQQAYSVLHAGDQKEIAQILKNNLLPLLGEIVVKYHQNERIRDIVMVIVHNIVRVDKGAADALFDAVMRLVQELSRVANLPDKYQEYLGEGLIRAADKARLAQNEVMERLAGVIFETLHAKDANPAALRQAENLLISLLQNQSSMMSVLHFILPLQTPEGRAFAEMYVDPESSEHTGKNAGENGRKIFLSVDSEEYGSFEFCFWQANEKVDFTLWCPQVLVSSLSGAAMRRAVGEMMQARGYTLKAYTVEEFVRPQTIAQVFPKLLDRRVGIDVRI